MVVVCACTFRAAASTLQLLLVFLCLFGYLLLGYFSFFLFGGAIWLGGEDTLDEQHGTVFRRGGSNAVLICTAFIIICQWCTVFDCHRCVSLPLLIVVASGCLLAAALALLVSCRWCFRSRILESTKSVPRLCCSVCFVSGGFVSSPRLTQASLASIGCSPRLHWLLCPRCLC